jgi:hypothetical protein
LLLKLCTFSGKNDAARIFSLLNGSNMYCIKDNDKTGMPLPSRTPSQTACDVTRKAKRQNLFTFSESIKCGDLIILMED